MKIIKEGNVKPKEIRKTCHKCGTVFTYTEADVQSDRDGKYVNCPKCNAFTAHIKA